jgi:hypothetical protein
MRRTQEEWDQKLGEAKKVMVELRTTGFARQSCPRCHLILPTSVKECPKCPKETP